MSENVGILRYNTFSCSFQVSMKVKLIIDMKIDRIKDIFLIYCIIIAKPVHKCWHFNIYKQDKFHAE